MAVINQVALVLSVMCFHFNFLISESDILMYCSVLESQSHNSLIVFRGHPWMEVRDVTKVQY